MRRSQRFSEVELEIRGNDGIDNSVRLSHWNMINAKGGCPISIIHAAGTCRHFTKFALPSCSAFSFAVAASSDWVEAFVI
jgi:hypothetical protein